METELIQPTQAQIKTTIQAIKKRLREPAMNAPINRPVKQGYEEVINILVDDRRTYNGIDLDTIQARAIAVLGVDYLNGECTQRVLVEVPIKK